MSCVSNVTLNGNGEKKVNVFLKIIWIWVAVGGMFAAPLNAGAAESLRFRHILTLYADEQGMGLNHPQGVAYIGNSVLVVADTGNNRLLRYALSDDGLKPKVTELKPAAMVFPQRVRVNRQGDIYVFDGKLRRVLHLSPEGGFLGFVDPSGLPSPGKTVIRSFDIGPNNSIYFLDIFSKRVIVCNADGTAQSQVQFPATYGFFSDIAVDAEGNIFVVDSINAQVYAARSGTAELSPLSQNLKEYVRYPTDLALDRQGRIYLSDHNGSKIIILARTGAYSAKLSALGWKEGLLDHPSQICLNALGHLCAADTSNNRVQIFNEVK